MIFGIGTDIIEVERIKNLLVKDTHFRNKIFSAIEINYCESRKAGKYQSYAVRFAAKEAFFKALGTGWRGNMAFEEIEIINNRLGKPEISVHGNVKTFVIKKKISNMHVTLSHIKNIAKAVVILEL